jgi:sugar O-acyltransferase (sialic acid O-acetyltransferase NeuD family)
MKSKIILIGAGTHSNSCIDVIELQKKYSIYGLVDKIKPISKFNEKYKYLGTEKNLKQIRKHVDKAIVSIGFVHEYISRNRVFNKIIQLKFKIPKIISPISYVSKKSTIGPGTVVFHNVVINSNACIGANCIINTSSLIEHDVTIGNNSHVSTGAIINGSVTIGSNTFIGSGSIICNNVKIGNNCFIKMGSKITKNIINNSKV